MRAPAVVPLLLCLAACRRVPSAFEPGVERRPHEIPNRHALAPEIRMNDPRAHLYFRAGISPHVGASTWRWADRRAVLGIPLPDKVEGRKLKVDLTIPAFTFDQTGPVVVSFFVNGQQAGSQRYDTQGEKRFEQDVPPALLLPGADNEVAIEIDKTGREIDGKTERGFILTWVGLVP